MLPESRSWAAVATSSLFEATTSAAGSPRATSRAKLGPERTAKREENASGSDSRITWLMRRCVFSSRPFVALTRSWPGSSQGLAYCAIWRIAWEGGTSSTRSAPSRHRSKSECAVTFSGMGQSGRKTGLRRSRLTPSTTFASRAHKPTCFALGAQAMASAVPQLPAPITASFRIMRGSPNDFPCRRGASPCCSCAYK